MKMTELRQQSASDLRKLLETTRENIREARFQIAAGKKKNVDELREARKTVAKILTILKS